jgi:Domain of unknown function (DUF5919)
MPQSSITSLCFGFVALPEHKEALPRWLLHHDCITHASRTSRSHGVASVYRLWLTCRPTAASGDERNTRMTNLTLRVLLQQRHWQKYSTFCVEYDRAARGVDPRLVGHAPSRAQLQRWISGSVQSRPYPDHCRVLEAMFPGWTADQLFAPYSEKPRTVNSAIEGQAAEPETASTGTLDLTRVFTDRSAFLTEVPLRGLLEGARQIRAAGLSLNLICQNYPDHQLRAILGDGTTIQCLFADPDGPAIRVREQEEGHPAGHLSTLTRLNIQVMLRLREQLDSTVRDRLDIAVYEETIRFNLLLVDTTACVMQPYLPAIRGVDSPTFLIRPGVSASGGLFTVFEQVFSSLRERSKPL